MDHPKESGDFSFELLDTIIEGVMSLEQGRCKNTINAIKKRLRTMDAQNRATGKPTNFERWLRKTLSEKKKGKEMKDRIKKSKSVILVEEIPAGEFESYRYDYEKCSQHGVEFITDGTVEVLDRKYEPRKTRGGTDWSYKKVHISGANWLIRREWFECGNKVRRTIRIRNSWLETVDQASLEFLRFASILGYVGVRSVSLERGTGIICENGIVRDLVGDSWIPRYTPEGKKTLKIFFRDGTVRDIQLDVRPKFVGDGPLLSKCGWNPKLEEIFLDTIQATFLL